MKAHRYQIKIFEEGGTDVSPAEVVPVFHEWIRSGDFDELLIDVGDYKHVPGGPGIILVGLQSDYSFNDSAGSWGLTYTRKREEVEAVESIVSSIGRLAYAASRFQRESRFEGRIRFDPRRLELTLLDRLAAPNTEAGVRAVIPSVESALASASAGKAEIVPVSVDDPRNPIRLIVSLEDHVSLDSLIRSDAVAVGQEVSP